MLYNFFSYFKAKHTISIAKRVSNILTEKLLANQVVDEEPMTLGEKNWKLRVKKVNKLSIFTLPFNGGNEKSKVVFPSISSGLLEGFKGKSIHLQVMFNLYSSISSIGLI